MKGEMNSPWGAGENILEENILGRLGTMDETPSDGRSEGKVFQEREEACAKACDRTVSG